MKVIRIKNCGDCPCYYPIGENQFFCSRKKVQSFFSKRRTGEIPDWCPLEDEEVENA